MGKLSEGEKNLRRRVFDLLDPSGKPVRGRSSQLSTVTITYIFEPPLPLEPACTSTTPTYQQPKSRSALSAVPQSSRRNSLNIDVDPAVSWFSALGRTDFARCPTNPQAPCFLRLSLSPTACNDACMYVGIAVRLDRWDPCASLCSSLSHS